MYQPWKTDKHFFENERFYVDILGVNKTKWTNGDSMC